MNSDDTAGESKDVRRKRAIRVALFTTIIGLVVGAALIVGGSLLVELSRDGLDTIAIPPAAAIAGATGIVILFAYVFGGLFALVAAVALARYVFCTETSVTRALRLSWFYRRSPAPAFSMWCSVCATAARKATENSHRY